MTEEIQLNKAYKHKNGNIYTPILFTNTKGDDEAKRKKYPPTVVYTGKNGFMWSRRIDDWDRSFTLIK